MKMIMPSALYLLELNEGICLPGRCPQLTWLYRNCPITARYPQRLCSHHAEALAGRCAAAQLRVPWTSPGAPRRLPARAHSGGRPSARTCAPPVMHHTPSPRGMKTDLPGHFRTLPKTLGSSGSGILEDPLLGAGDSPIPALPWERFQACRGRGRFGKDSHLERARAPGVCGHGQVPSALQLCGWEPRRASLMSARGDSCRARPPGRIRTAFISPQYGTKGTARGFHGSSPGFHSTHSAEVQTWTEVTWRHSKKFIQNTKVWRDNPEKMSSFRRHVLPHLQTQSRSLSMMPPRSQSPLSPELQMTKHWRCHFRPTFFPMPLRLKSCHLPPIHPCPGSHVPLSWEFLPPASPCWASGTPF